ncbi:LysR family transcriptional regulator [Intrasporangium sp. DVR]|uniref:LysR family transcriptional regulator n=1 Tax=Intrasporangium sp. DVR TaxID=3127867 RepID=UPI00313A65E9
MSLTLRQLEIFQAVAGELHFGRAADRLRLSQPTVSKELARLERALGVELFHRSSGGTVLTPDGAELLQRAERVLEAAAELDRTAAAVRRRRTTEVRVAASPSVVNRLMPQVLRQLEHQHPDVHVTAVEVDTGGVTPTLDAGVAEVGLGHHVAAPVHGKVRTIGRDELFVIAAESVVGRGRTVELDRLVDVPLILWPREQSPTYHDAVLEICRSRGLEPLLLSGTSRVSGSRSYLLREGRAFALGPRDFAQSESHGVRAVALSPSAFVPLDLAWVEPPSPAARTVMAQVRALVR